MKPQSILPARYIAAALLACGLVHAAPAAPKAEWSIIGAERADLVIVERSTPRFRLEALRVGHGWIHPKLGASKPVVENGRRIWEEKGVGFYKSWWDKEPTGGRHDLRVEVVSAGGNAVRIELQARPDHEQVYGFPNDGVGLGFKIVKSPYFKGGDCRLELSDGKVLDKPYPLPRDGHGKVKSLQIKTAAGVPTTFSFDPPVFIHADNDEVRMFAAPGDKTAAGGVMKQTIVVTLAQPFAFEPANRWVDTANWIVLDHPAANDFSPGSVIGAEEWLEKPAGKHGWLKMDGDRFVFTDGTPVKFWGSNISWNHMACAPEVADQWNDKWAKLGVNLVRLHKFLDHEWAGIMTREDHMVPNPNLIGKFDYFHASAKKRGIYLAWSASYRFKVTPADKDKVWFYDEIVANDPKEMGTYEYHMKSYAPDLQDLLIAQTINLLTRTNSVTGIRYADDPALAYIELHNEEDIFMAHDDHRGLEKAYPKYFAAFQQRFNDWLKKKYGTQEALQKAWGTHYPQGKDLGEIRPRYPSWGVTNIVDPYMADTMKFMYDEQLSFYQRFVKAIRATGYQGAICGSCWQASNWPGHLLNTLTDYEVGFIDRHNYAPTFLDNPGVGNFSVGFQQVKNRPFNLSEWGGGPVDVPTVAIYGLGLQGWDASCQFSSTKPTILNKMGRDCNSCCDDFIQMAQYPLLARTIYRGDVKEGDIVANRQVSIPDLFQGKVGFLESFSLLGGANNKEFSSVVPSAALMAGRVLMEFVDGPTPAEPVFSVADKYLDIKAGIVRSTTGQLLWDYENRYYTVNTPGTQAVFGYVKGRNIALDDVSFSVATDTSVKLYVVAMDKGATIKTGKRLLVAAFGRDANTGMMFDEFDGDNPRGLTEGGEPLLLEPVEATITLKGRTVKAVLPLDHGGRLRDGASSLPVKGGTTFTLDGRQTKTMYYLVELK